MKYLITLLLCHSITICSLETNDIQNKKYPNTQKKVEVLLIGTSHWNNYQRRGLDVAQTSEIDILSEKYQKDLHKIILSIRNFNPDKIFVERTIDQQSELDSMYQAYRTGNWDWDDSRRSEVFQLGFRVAKMLDHERVIGVDFRDASFPYDSLMNVMEKAKQLDLIKLSNQFISGFEEDYDSLVDRGKSLQEILFFLNGKKYRSQDLGWYLNIANQGGDIDNNIGSVLATEWIKRNVFTYSLIQKYVDSTDERIMVLLGASHIAVIENLISYNPNWDIVELEQVVRSSQSY